MEIWTALILGLGGSLHCAGMCGPLVLAIPGKSVLTRVLYQLGRIMTYAVIGGITGAVGATLALAGWQRWLSISAGVVILIAGLMSSRFATGLPAVRFVVRLKTIFAKLLHHRSAAASLLLGSLNGLLPCGLVYVAAAGAAASGSVYGGIKYMLAFGLATWPMMLAISLGGRLLPLRFRLQLPKLTPISIVLVAALLILRGLGLGIPYLSPGEAGHKIQCPACQQGNKSIAHP